MPMVCMSPSSWSGGPLAPWSWRHTRFLSAPQQVVLRGESEESSYTCELPKERGRHPLRRVAARARKPALSVVARRPRRPCCRSATAVRSRKSVWSVWSVWRACFRVGPNLFSSGTSSLADRGRKECLVECWAHSVLSSNCSWSSDFNTGPVGPNNDKGGANETNNEALEEHCSRIN